MPSKIKYMNGDKIGECIFLKDVKKTGKQRRGEFKCICGKIFYAVICNVKNKKQVSCGCVKNKNLANRSITHGLSRVNGRTRPEYSAYYTMLSRCYNQKDKHYKWYGERGISVCERWLKGFKYFIEDMGLKPDKNLSLDRTDNDKGYSKENCKWVTHKEQCNNRRNSLKYLAKSFDN